MNHEGTIPTILDDKIFTGMIRIFLGKDFSRESNRLHAKKRGKFGKHFPFYSENPRTEVPKTEQTEIVPVNAVPELQQEALVVLLGDPH